MSLRGYGSWVWLGTALAMIAVLSLVSVRGTDTGVPLSLSSARPNGALALSLWLNRLGYQVERETQVGLGLAATNPAGAALLLLGGGSAPTQSQARAILAWTARGGRLVVVGKGDGDTDAILAPLGLNVVLAGSGGVEVTQPLLLAPPVARLDGTASAVLIGLPQGAVAASTGEGPALLWRRVGAGTLWLLTAPTLLDNAHLGLADNRSLALNLVGNRGTVLVDEYQPSVPGGGSGWLTGTSWGIALLFALAVLVLYRWLAGRRLGPPLPAMDEPPRLAAEYVTSLAGILRRAGRRRDVLRMYGQRLERMASERGRFDEELEDLLAEPRRMGEDEVIERAAAMVEFEARMRRPRV